MSESKKQGLFATLKGVIAAMLGVQSRQKHEEDFAQGSASSYILVGLIVVAVFILAVVAVVNIVMSSAGI